MNIHLTCFHELIFIFLGLFGAILGSFLNVCIDRLLYHSNNLSDRLIPQGWQALMIPARSFCFACGVTIAWYDNIPILSYVVLRGKCRHCLVPFGIRSLLIELCCLFTFVITAIFLSKIFYENNHYSNC